MIDHADFSAPDSRGIIGDSADKRFTIIRGDFKSNDPTRPEHFYIIDWHAAADRRIWPSDQSTKLSIYDRPKE